MNRSVYMKYLSVKEIAEKWNYEKEYLVDTCLAAQDKYKAYLDYFKIKYE